MLGDIEILHQPFYRVYRTSMKDEANVRIVFCMSFGYCDEICEAIAIDTLQTYFKVLAHLGELAVRVDVPHTRSLSELN